MRARYQLAALCVFLFIAAQTFQELAYRFWIPASHGPQDDLRAYLLPVDRVRAILILVTIITMVVPFVVIALRYFKVAPLSSILGVVFGVAFIGFEVSHRSLDFFFVGERWAPQFVQAASAADRDLILQRFAVWNDLARGWFFPLMLSFMLASCAFAFASWTDRRLGSWYYLAPIAYAVNALRLFGRILSTFMGQRSLDGLNDQLYFPIVFSINALLLLWFLTLAREEPHAAQSYGAKSSSQLHQTVGRVRERGQNE